MKNYGGDMKIISLVLVSFLISVCASNVVAAKEPYVFKSYTFNSPDTLLPPPPEGRGNYWYWVKDANGKDIMECRKNQDDKDFLPKGYGECKLSYEDRKFGDRYASAVTAEYFNDKLMKITIYQQAFPKMTFQEHYNTNNLIDDLEKAFGVKFGSALEKAPFKPDQDYSTSYLTYNNKKYPAVKSKQIYISNNDLKVKIVRKFNSTHTNINYELIDNSLNSEYEKAYKDHRKLAGQKDKDKESNKIKNSTKDF